MEKTPGSGTNHVENAQAIKTQPKNSEHTMMEVKCNSKKIDLAPAGIKFIVHKIK